MASKVEELSNIVKMTSSHLIEKFYHLHSHFVGPKVSSKTGLFVSPPKVKSLSLHSPLSTFKFLLLTNNCEEVSSSEIA